MEAANNAAPKRLGAVEGDVGVADDLFDTVAKARNNGRRADRRDPGRPRLRPALNCVGLDVRQELFSERHRISVIGAGRRHGEDFAVVMHHEFSVAVGLAENIGADGGKEFAIDWSGVGRGRSLAVSDVDEQQGDRFARGERRPPRPHQPFVKLPALPE